MTNMVQMFHSITFVKQDKKNQIQIRDRYISFKQRDLELSKLMF